MDAACVVALVLYGFPPEGLMAGVVDLSIPPLFGGFDILFLRFFYKGF